jgi:hypothetical protein
LKFPALHSTGQVVCVYTRKAYWECEGVAVLTRTLPLIKRPWYPLKPRLNPKQVWTISNCTKVNSRA